MTSPANTDEEIQDLTDRVALFNEQIQSGKLSIAPHLVDDFFKSLQSVRLLPDGRVDPETVDGRVRSASRAVQYFKQRDESKRSFSLAQIQETYFEVLFRQLGWLYDHMVSKQVTPPQVAARVSRDSELTETIHKGLPDLVNALQEFWDVVALVGSYHLQDSHDLKATFAGDLFPGHSRNVVSSAGLYLDTVVLPCPVMRVGPLLHSTMSKQDLVEMFVKHVLTAMTYRDVALADVQPPIAVIVPNPSDIGRDDRHGIFERAKPAVLKHAQYLFGREFDSVDHLAEFCGKLASVDQVMAELKGPDRLLFATEWEDRDPRAQLTRALKNEFPQPKGMDASIAGNHVFGACLGRMPQALAAKENAADVGGTPLVHAETSWLYFTWMLQYEASPLATESAEGMHVARALMVEREQNLEWLGNVPPQSVIDIRRAGLAGEVRAILGQGVSDLLKANPTNFFRTADQVVDNLGRAFEAHQRALNEARNKKLKLYGVDVPTCIATGAIGVAAALTGSVALGVVGGVLGAAGLPNLREIKSRIGAIAAEDRIRRASPTGLLFQHIRR